MTEPDDHATPRPRRAAPAAGRARLWQRLSVVVLLVGAVGAIWYTNAWLTARFSENTRVRAELRLALGVEAAPAFHQIVRWERAIPQYQLGHLQRVAGIEERTARHPGLFLAGNAYRGVALNDCTEQAEVMAARVARVLDRRT